MDSGELHSAKYESTGADLTIEGVRRIEGDTAERAPLILRPGTLTLVLGANGVGKSHFLEQLAGLRKPEQLSIRYGSEPLWLPRRMAGTGQRLNPQALLQYGYAAQSPEQGLFMRTVEEEIRYSYRPYANGKSANAEDVVQVNERALAAVGWDRTWLDRDPQRMSGGERRRAALAALFATPAAWLLLDEPTAGLDRDGHDKLAAHLGRLKRGGTGIVMVSHDADWALPLAERVLLFHSDGSVRDCDPAALIAHPQWLTHADLCVPLWLQLISKTELARTDDDTWRNAVDVAQALSADRKPIRHFSNDADGQYAPFKAEHIALQQAAAAGRPEPPVARLPLNHFDPRAIWLGYVLLSVGLFSLSTWAGLAAGAGIVAALLLTARIPLARWKGIMIGFALFGTALAAFAATGISRQGGFPLTWDATQFFGTLFPFVRTFIVLLIGLGVPLVMTPLSLRRALDQLVPYNRRVPAAWQRIVLTITLTIRFVPVLLGEWERFGRIFLARGKETGWSPAVTLRRLKGITLPLLLALFRLADEVSVALESRGVRKDVQPSRTARLRWGWRDTALTCGAALLAALLWMVD